MSGDGNWREMFEQGRGGRSMPPPTPPRDEPDDDDTRGLDLAEYRPWTVQRGRSRPAMMLELRRYEPRSALWIGWQLSYPTLVAVEYTGDRLLSLDFGTRQFVIEGRGLDELARHIQQGAVLAIHEYATAIWPTRRPGAMVAAIRRIEPEPTRGR